MGNEKRASSGRGEGAAGLLFNESHNSYGSNLFHVCCGPYSMRVWMVGENSTRALRAYTNTVEHIEFQDNLHTDASKIINNNGSSTSESLLSIVDVSTTKHCYQ